MGEADGRLYISGTRYTEMEKMGMKQENLKQYWSNRHKIIQRVDFKDGKGEKDVVIDTTFLYKSRLYMRFKFLLGDESEDYHVAAFNIDEQEIILMEDRNDETEKEEIRDIIEAISLHMKENNVSGRHFIWLEDSSSLISEPPLFENNQEKAMAAIKPTCIKVASLIQIIGSGYIVFLWFIIFLRELEDILQYRHWEFVFAGKQIIITAAMVRLCLVLICVLLCIGVWRLNSRIFKCSILGTILIIIGLFLMLMIHILYKNDSFIQLRYASGMEYMFTAMGDEKIRGDIYTKQVGETFIIPYEENRHLVEETEKYSPWQQRQFTAAIELNTSFTELMRYSSKYNANTNCMEIEIPELGFDYQYAFVIIWLEDETDSVASIVNNICLGQRPRLWYQHILDTDAEYGELSTEDSWKELIEAGEIGAGKLTRWIWYLFMIKDIVIWVPAIYIFAFSMVIYLNTYICSVMLRDICKK